MTLHTTPEQLPEKLKEILIDFYDDMQDTKEQVRVDSYDMTDNTYSDQHQDWENDTFEKAVNKIMKELSTLETKHRAEVEKAVEAAKEQAYKNVGSWYKLPKVDIDTGKCMTCGSEGVYIRGKFPGSDNRQVCAVCSYEILESIFDSCNNRIASEALTTTTSERVNEEK